jgi:uncharacterized OB-fold protein
MTQQAQKPLPVITDLNKEFWQSARKGELRLQTCRSCGHIRNPISEICPKCLSEDFEWTKLSGKGTVFSFVTFHQVYHPAYKGDVPYNVSIIQLDEGPRMISNVVGVPPSDVAVGQKVEVLFDHVSDECTIPRFRLAGRKD